MSTQVLAVEGAAFIACRSRLSLDLLLMSPPYASMQSHLKGGQSHPDSTRPLRHMHAQHWKCGRSFLTASTRHKPEVLAPLHCRCEACVDPHGSTPGAPALGAVSQPGFLESLPAHKVSFSWGPGVTETLPTPSNPPHAVRLRPTAHCQPQPGLLAPFPFSFKKFIFEINNRSLWF